MAAGGSGGTRVTFLSPEKPDEEVPRKKLDKLTVRYNRKDLQRRLKLEEWIDSQIQELYQSQTQLRGEVSEPEIDIDDLVDLCKDEQKSRLQEILQECSKPTEDFTKELLHRLKGLRKISSFARK
ncbi:protein phosphatase 1 regulatory subunit 14D [Ascaphus truei]|uniref:protein phosphatase 1 regulatory subunit 14D n=1 Tax=Ascaphus truei TaxID=8439 RepID=UPI003F590C7A